MNRSQSILPWIFAIIAINMMDSAFSYEPLFVIEWSDGYYSFPPDAKYDREKNHYIVLAPRDQKILLLCTQNGIPGSYNVIKIETNEAIVDEGLCQWPFIWRIFKSEYHNKIGFAIYPRGKQSSIGHRDVTEDFKVLKLIGFIFNESRGRTELVWYNLTPGYLLHAEINHGDEEEGDIIGEQEEFEENKDFYGYDIDEKYVHYSNPFTKMPLAPEQDFLYPNHKAATRNNVLTAPMWPELKDQWQALEIFTRKVAQVLSFLSIRVGVHGSIMKPDHGKEQPSPMFLNSVEGKYPIPQYFYKIVVFRFAFENGNRRVFQKEQAEEGELQDEEEEQVHRYGILFVMHNSRVQNPYTEWNYEEICPEDQTKIKETGWMNFLPASQFKSPMYACLYNEENMRKFQKQLYKKFDIFNLNDLPTLAVDPQTGKEVIRNKNVLEEMKWWEKANKDNNHAQSNETLMQAAYESFQGDLNRHRDIPLELAEENLQQRNEGKNALEEMNVGQETNKNSVLGENSGAEEQLLHGTVKEDSNRHIPPEHSEENNQTRKRRRRWSSWDQPAY
ncbi:uncharacterized protein LOC135847471 [Planococcus citri]|uniref:uncharacterized protein LOC135847471 n=1 Tax=Planococcus citri TaxID=170843 RepID=UPI0031F99C9E